MRGSLENVKAGDQVLLEQGRSDLSVVTIKRTTKTQIIICDKYNRERKFRRRGGQEVGSTGYHSPTIREYTPEQVTRYEEWFLKAKLDHAMFLYGHNDNKKNRDAMTKSDRAALLSALLKACPTIADSAYFKSIG